MKPSVLLALSICLAAPAGSAAPFGQWTEQTFPRLPGNQWLQSPQQVDVSSDGSVSLIWTRLPASDGEAIRASWDWSVRESVPATRLDRKGGDDRNLALYFLFMPPERAEASRNANVRQLLRERDARVIMYVWGGKHARGEVLPSPYFGRRGRTIILRPAGTGDFIESVDLESDFVRSFGSPKTVLVGLAVSSDSDDTSSSVRARLGRVRLE